MSNVLVEKNKLDILANAISNKSGELLTLTLDEMVEAVDGIKTEANLQEKQYSVNKAGQELIQADDGYDGLSNVIVNVPMGSARGETATYSTSSYGTGQYNNKLYISASNVPTTPIVTEGYIKSGTVTNRSVRINTSIPYNPAITVNDDTVTVPRGYYSTQESKSVASGALYPTINAGYISPQMILDDDIGEVTASYYNGVNTEDIVQTSGWVNEGASANILIGVQETLQLPTQAGATITPTESAQTAVAKGKWTTGAVTVNAIPSNYVGSGITQRSSTDLTVSGATVTAPSGYYSASASGTVASGSLGLPTNITSKDSTYLYITKSYPNFTAGYFSSMSAQSTQLRLESKTVTPTTSQQTVTPTADNYYLNSVTVNAVATGTAGTPTATKGTVSNHSVSVTPSVTNTTGYITGGTINGTAVSVSASELVSGTLNVTSAGTKDVTNYASASIPSGTAGTPTATKGTVSNHSVSVTPSVTNTTGFITGSTKSGTAVTVSASELVSGSETKTENGTYDVTNLAEIVIDVQGGGSSGVQAAVATPQSGANSYVLFGNLAGIPTSFSLINAYDITIDDTPIVSALTFDGTNYVGQLATNLSNANARAMSTGFSHSYDSQENQIGITSENAAFDTYSHYILVYTYGGSASDIQTADVQVGSGATSITFPVNGRPTYWSCVFKSDFGTSSGYQRVIAVANDGTNTYGTYGLCLDSSAHASNTYWTASYSGGNFTITSQGTNAGGYFHQPGYYQLTYIVDESAPSYQTKTVTPTTSQQTVTPDSGYDALSQVTVNAIPSQYVVPSGNLAITQNGTNINVSNYATVSVNVSGGGVNIDTKTVTASNYPTSLSFTGMNGEPKAFFLKATSQISSSGSTTYYYIINMRYNGTNTTGSVFRIGSTRQVNHITSGYSWSYSGTTLTITSNASSRSASPGAFNNGYELVYIY